MLNVMRDNLKHLKPVLWIVALSMVAYLGAFFSCDSGGGAAARGGADAPWAARINGTEIPASRLLRAAQTLDRNYRELFGTNYDQVKNQLQIGSAALRSLVEQQIILDDAAKLGLTASKEDIAKEIRTNPNFQNATGSFIGTETYVRVVTQAYGGVSNYEQIVADQIVTEQWLDLIAQSVTLDAQEIEKAYRERTEKVAFDYVVVPSADQESSVAPGDSELQAWYDAHSADYRREEGRDIRYVVVERQAELAKITISDEQLTQAYETRKADFDRPEQRQARHILFRAEPGATDEDKAALLQKAEETLARVQGGEDFATLAQALSEDPVSGQRGGDLGFFGRGAMVGAFEEAVFNTPSGEFAPIVETQFGFHVIQVTDSRAAGIAPLDDVVDELRQSLRVTAADANVAAAAERLRADAKTAADLQTIAARDGLSVQTRFLTRDDQLREIGAPPDFTGRVFEIAPGEVSQPMRVATGMAVVAVDRSLPAGVPPLDDVRDAVRNDVINDMARQAAVAKARKALDSSGGFTACAGKLKLDVRQSGDVSPGRGLIEAGGSTPEFESTMFGAGTSVGDSGVVKMPSGALVYEVTRKDVFDPVAFESAKSDLREELLAERRNQHQRAIVNQLVAQQEVVQNDELLRSIDGG